MLTDFEELDVVTLLQDVNGIASGTSGTIVVVHDSDHVMVEFCDGDGVPLICADGEDAIITLDTSQLKMDTRVRDMRPSRKDGSE